MAWGDIDHKAILLSGPPGTGKTTFADALAKSAGLPLVKTSVSEWNAAMHLNGTLQAMQKAFDDARRVAPAVLLIDELDGISRRDRIGGEYWEYWAQIINHLLTLLSDPAYGKVVIVAATNRPEAIDPAILRSGRISRHVAIALPDVTDLRSIFDLRLGDALGSSEIRTLASIAVGCTGADVKEIVTAEQASARRAQRTLDVDDVLHQIARHRPVWSAETRYRIAVHEIGHALVGHRCKVGELKAVGINGTGGVTEFAAAVEASMSRDDVIATIAMLLAGRIAEELVFDSVSLGAGGTPKSDLPLATGLAMDLEINLGMGRFGNIYIDGLRPVDLLTVPALHEAVRDSLSEAERTARRLLSEDKAVLLRLAEKLAACGYMLGLKCWLSSRKRI